MIYFSLITIVGVGYGDILPLLPFPRMLAAVEAVVGHFYMAVLIGWLVGMFISQALRPVRSRRRRKVESSRRLNDMATAGRGCCGVPYGNRLTGPRQRSPARRRRRRCGDGRPPAPGNLL